MTVKQCQCQQGFTLIELSIVLVIIGLIVGGVLVGQDLIQAAKIRSQVSQFEKINTAANTFRTKYNAIPGDLNIDDTVTGFAARSNANARGDGDNVIEAAEGIQCSETYLFWGDLADAGLIDGGSFSTAIDYDGTDCHSGPITVNDFIPAGKIGGHITVYSTGSVNYYQLSSVTALAEDTGVATSTALLKNIDAFNIDTKMDDGIPVSGLVVAMDGVVLNDSATADGTCIETSTIPDIYDIQTAVAQAEAECQLRVRSQF